MMRWILLIFWITLQIIVVVEAASDVVQLEDVAAQVLDSSSIWAVFANDSSTTTANKKLSPVMEVVASLMKGIHNVGEWNANTSNVPESWGGSSSNTVLVFLGDDKGQPWRKVTFKNDARSFYEEVLEAMTKAKEVTVENRARELSTKIPKEKATRKPRKKKSAFVKVDESNFEALVLNNSAVVALALTAPWCGHCQRLLPEWKEAAQLLGDEDVVMGWVDATTETKIAAQYQVQGYPTIKIFPGGSNSLPYDYPGERSATGLTEFLLQEVERSGVPKPVPELVEPSQLEDACSGSNHLCVIAALPHILDTGAAGRQNYLISLSKVARTFRKNFSFLWFEGGNAQVELETTLGLTFGFPALVAISLDREALAVMHGAFRETNIQTFLHGITTGRQSVMPLQVPGADLPVATTEPWDGKDGKPLEDEDDFDLEAFLNDEL
jgi:protein disulfide-isomerase A6